MSDAPKNESAVTAEPPAVSSVTSQFPGMDTDSALGAAAHDRGDDTVYRPLSSFAVAGFSIAMVYAAIVIIGAIVAAIQRMPWLMGGWSAVLPVVALVLAAVAWLQIQASEGTRSGKRLAVWAATLSVIVSLGY